MRGGTSKGLFFRPEDLPADPQQRDAVLLRAIGSPDPYAKHIDGMGGATSSTSKVVLVSRSSHPRCDVDYRFGAVAIGEPLIDWSGNCGNLSAAVGPFALAQGLLAHAPDVPRDGIAQVRIWQVNIQKRITAHVPMCGGRVVEDGDYVLDGVAFPGAEIRLDFHDPAGSGDQPLLPTGLVQEELAVPGIGTLPVSLVNAGNPTVFVAAQHLGISGTELPAALNQRGDFLARCELVRAHAAVRMGLAATAAEATLRRPATPKLALVSASADYRRADGQAVAADEVDLNVRMLSMGAVHHAIPGTGAIGVAVAVALPGSVAAQVCSSSQADESAEAMTRIGHPSGRALVAATVRQSTDLSGVVRWVADTATLARSARCLMRGEVLVPNHYWPQN
jgi:probable AcnD-accessory protein PrpF